MAMTRNLKRSTALWGLAKYASLLATLVTTAVLSRILTPEEYGVVAVTAAFSALFAVLADVGYGTAIIQNRRLSAEDIDDIYSFSVLFSIMLGLAFALLGIPISHFYENAVYRRICALLGLSVVFTSMNTVPNALIMRDKRFLNSGLRMIAACVVAGGIAIVMALKGLSYYAIIGQNLLFSVITFFWNRLTVRLRFHLKMRAESLKKVGSFSAYQFLYSMMRYFAGNMDTLLIGKTMGSVPLAYYDKGHKLMMYPVQNLTNYVVNPILVPILSEHQADRAYLYQAYARVVRVLSCLGILCSVFFFWGAEEAMILFFGGQWGEAVPVFRLLSLSIWPQMVASSASAIYQSIGDTRRMFVSGLVYFGLTIALIVAGVCTGSLETLVWLVVAAQYGRFAIDYYVLIGRTLNMSYRCFIGQFWFECLYAGVMAAVIALVPVTFTSRLLRLFVKGCAALAVFLVMAVVTGKYAQIRETLFSKK